ncbi:hypothetical protein DL96DRAFT_1627462 [Flagelloscypha sp. PMI_526]|nr:hypothetical protein DL96DRAFT_1627462 [Flagelloscypha sp. PMI_526]
MSITEDSPDEVLERILLFATARDIDGRIARAIYSVSHRWNHIISPVLYTHVAYKHTLGTGVSATNSRETAGVRKSISEHWRIPSFSRSSEVKSSAPFASASLFHVLKENRTRVEIQHLLICDTFMPKSIYQQLAQFSHRSLRTLTIWPTPYIQSRLSFFDETNVPFPHLQRVTFIGDIGRREHNWALRTTHPPRFPSLTHLCLVGSIIIPPFAHSDDVPQLSTARYSHLTYDDASAMLRDFPTKLRLVRDGLNRLGDFTPKLIHWRIIHAPPLGRTHGSAIEIFRQRVNAVEALIKQPWASGFTFSIQEDAGQQPYERSSTENSWDAVIGRLAEDED